MPYKRKYGKRRKTFKRRPRRTNKRRRFSVRKQTILEGFPKQKLVKLRYVEQVSLDPGLGSYAVSEWRANSVFDPNLSGVGHQPMGFDQWSQIYERYVVCGSKINVQFAPITVGSVAPGFYGISMYGTAGQLVATYPGNLDSVMESKLSGKVHTMAGNFNSAATPTQLSRNFSAKKFFGKSNVTDDTDIGATISANPTNQAYFGVWYGTSGGNDPGIANFKVMIDYIVLFHEPFLLTAS